MRERSRRVVVGRRIRVRARGGGSGGNGSVDSTRSGDISPILVPRTPWGIGNGRIERVSAGSTWHTMRWCCMPHRSAWHILARWCASVCRGCGRREV